MPGSRVTRLPYVMRQAGRGGVGEYLYYRRDGRTEKLPGSEGSAAFLAAYDQVHARFEGGGSRHTVAAAIDGYVSSTAFKSLAEASRRNYELYLGEMRARAGHLALSDISVQWVDRLREALSEDVHRWNRLRDLMKVVTKRYSRLHPDAGILVNAWEDAARLKVGGSDQNRAWPADVLISVMRQSTPEFRALITCLLLTGQRLADVCGFRPEQYDSVSATLGYASAFSQHKTGTPLVLHVPTPLAAVLDSMRGRRADRLLVTPRGKPWLPSNAQETLAGIRARLRLDRYTLHGLRATGPTHLAQSGSSLHEIMAMTGHKTEAQLRRYLKGVEKYPLARIAQEGVAVQYAPVILQSLEGANTKSFSGKTGRAAANAGVVGQSSRRKRIP